MMQIILPQHITEIRIGPVHSSLRKLWFLGGEHTVELLLYGPFGSEAPPIITYHAGSALELTKLDEAAQVRRES